MTTKTINTLSLGFLLVLAGAGSLLMLRSETSGTIARNTAVGSNLGSPFDTSDWLTYKDDELGVSFKYPTNHSIEIEKEIPKFDQGNLYVLRIRDAYSAEKVSIIGTSSDFVQGVEEGSRWYWSGPSLGLASSSLELAELLQKNFYYASTPHLISTNNWQGITFYIVRVDYGQARFHKTILIPLNTTRYTSLMLVSGEYVENQLPDNSAISKNISLEVKQQFENFIASNVMPSDSFMNLFVDNFSFL